MSIAAEYVEAVVRRAREPMEPADFLPDWADQPLRHKTYAGGAVLPLPSEPARLNHRLGDCLTGAAAGGSGAFTLSSLAAMLRHSYGLLGRRLRVTGNDDSADRPIYRNAVWSRGTASGGGLYPCEIYWVCGPSGPLLPGVYHYSTPHHAMRRLLAGDVSTRVAAAVAGHRETAETDQFLLVTVKFWKNAFKYNSFCYHVVTMDLGALLNTWQLWSRALDVPLRPALWFDEPALDELLGIDADAESVLAVVPVPWRPSGEPGEPGGFVAAPAGATPGPAVVKREIERSRTVIRFPQIERVHRAAMECGDARPLPESLATAAVRPPRPTQTVPLPPIGPGWLTGDLADVLRRRRSSFGQFSERPVLSAADLGSLLAAGGSGRHLDSDVRYPDGGPPLTRLAVFVNHVDGITPGVYDYDHERHALNLVPGEPVSPFLQHQYFLNNYNLEQAAAVAVVVARPAAAIKAVGDRGVRVVNAEVGAVAETTYLAAAALGVGCGAALGFDNVAIAERLGIDGGDQRPLLLLMLGHERSAEADIDHRLL